MKTLSVFLMTCLFVASAQAKYSGGSGTAQDPYQIATAADLIALGETPADCDKHFLLTADIDLDPNLPGRRVFDKAVIARDWDTPFSGVFDGNGHVISHLATVLFGQLAEGAEVRDLHVVDGPLAAENYGRVVNCHSSGVIEQWGCGLIEYNRGVVTQCSNSAAVSGTDPNHGNGSAGGLVLSNEGDVRACWNTGTVKDVGTVGGLAGWNLGTIVQCRNAGQVRGGCCGGLVGTNDGTMVQCYSTGAVVGDPNAAAGGLAGANTGIIRACYSTGSVDGPEMAGGIVGYGEQKPVHWYNPAATLIHCYSTGTVTGKYAGGLVGYGEQQVVYSIWDMETSGLRGSEGGVGLTTAEMMDPQMLALNGFADDPNWVLDAGRDYPRLTWQGTPGQMIGPPHVDWLQGSGAPEDPYRITIADQLIRLGKSGVLWDRHFALDADIDMDPNMPGMPHFGQALILNFAGTFDGGGHRISHLTLTGNHCLGLFGRLASRAEVNRLGMVDVTISGLGESIGGLVGHNSGKVSRCYSTGVVTGDISVGGLVGSSGTGNITMSHSTCSVSGNVSVGGLAGSASSGSSIMVSCSTGSASGSDQVGGLVGCSDESSITASYSTAGVSGDGGVGGLVGYQGGLVNQCYSAGAVQGKDSVGGLVGALRGTVTNCLWDSEASGQDTGDGAIGKTTAQMQSADTFLNAGWDFGDETLNGTCDFWQISPGEYPRLRYGVDESPVMPEGSGTAAQPYLIRDARDLGTVWFKPLAYYRLEASVDLSGTTWSLPVVPLLGGVFDGNGYVIRHLHIQGDNCLGLIGQMSSGAQVSDLGLEAVDVNGTGERAGGLVGWNDGGEVHQCHSTGTVTGGWAVGGLVGDNSYGRIVTSYSTALVKGRWVIGGLVGENGGGEIATSYASATVTGEEDVGGLVGWSDGTIATSHSTAVVTGNFYVGGLVGENGKGGRIATSYSAGTVTGNDEDAGGLAGSNSGHIAASYSHGTVMGNRLVGGLVGLNEEQGWIVACYSATVVTGAEYVGGLVGYDDDAVIDASFWDVNTSGQSRGTHGTGLPTSLMQAAATFLDAGWDFVGETANGTEDIWWILEGKDYPRLWWELSYEPKGDQ
jgi:hypothetical protein